MSTATQQAITLGDIYTRTVPPESRHQWISAGLNKFRRFLGHEPTVADLSCETFAKFGDWIESHGGSRGRRQSLLGQIRVIWKMAYAEKLTTNDPVLSCDKPLLDVRPQTPGTFEHAYVNQVRPKMKRAYQRSCDRAISRLRLWRGGPTPLANVTDELIDQFAAALQDSGLGVNSRKDYPQILRRILRLIDPDLCRPPQHGFKGTPWLIGPPGTLTHFANVYCDHRDLACSSQYQIRYAVKDFDKFLERPGVLADLNADTISEFLSHRIADGGNRKTIHGRRGTLLQLWREAHRRKLLPAVEDVRRIKVPKPIPRAWFVAEFVKLLAEADNLDGNFKSVSLPRRIVMRAIILTGYYTGLRPCDLLDLRTSDFMQGGVLVIRQKKTDEAIPIELPADCREAIAATYPQGRELVFPVSRKAVWESIRSLIKKAGIGGSLKWLRRTGATRCEQVQPGSAKAYLGHLTDGLAYRHYVDARQIVFTRPIPPCPTTMVGGAA